MGKCQLDFISRQGQPKTESCPAFVYTKEQDTHTPMPPRTPSKLQHIDSTPVIVRVNIPFLKTQKAFKVMSTDLIWGVCRMVAEKLTTDIKDVFNYGMYLAGKDGKKGKFLDDRNTVYSYHLENNTTLEFQLKYKVGAEPSDIKKQKRIMEDVQKGALDKLKEKVTKTTELNFCIENGDTPISVATMNNDSEMIIWLMDNGSFLDFRSGEKDQWKTPLHLAALYNKPNALKTLIQYGAWVDVKDAPGLTPLYYAAGAGNSECVLRLLLAKADTEITDENGRNVLHQATMNNYDCIVGLLIDFGANMEHVNVGGNTPLHVAASRSCKESTTWLLLRGADSTSKNKSGKSPYECALQASCTEICEIMDKFTPEQIVVPPPRYVPESISEYDGIVANVLSGLSSSIGKAYTPQYYMAGTPSNRAKSMSPMRKSMSAVVAPIVAPINEGETTSVTNLHTPITITLKEELSSSSSDKSISHDLHAETLPSNLGLLHHQRTGSSSTPLLPPKPSKPPFEIAWRKIEEVKPPANIGRIKIFIAEKQALSTGEEGANCSDMLIGMEDLERGLIKAAEKISQLRNENEILVKKLKSLGLEV